jgi:hypothetical protein
MAVTAEEELPEELARRQTRLHKIREAKAALEAEARHQASTVEAERQLQGKLPSGNDPNGRNGEGQGHGCRLRFLQ